MASTLLPDTLGNVTLINNFLNSVGVLVALLASPLQNGNSQLGLLPPIILPAFLGGSDGIPWGNKSAGNTNAYTDPPNTGVVRYYDFEITNMILAPDGSKTPMQVINGAFPGPTLEANWGDTFNIKVTNSLDEGTTLHWHGLLQKNTQYYDGVPSVAQCPIAPGESFTYIFQADLFGTSWYHSHYSAQYAGGLFGPMVIYGPTDNFPSDVNATEVLDLGPVILSDFYDGLSYYQLVQQDLSDDALAANLVTSTNTLIQGKGISTCLNLTGECGPDPGLAKFIFQPGKVHRLRLINTSAAAYLVVSLDSHEMTVVAYDFVPIVPYTVSQVILFVGQRADVLITASQTPGAYWLRTRQPILCSLSLQPFGLAAIYYNGTNTTEKPTTLPNLEFIEPVLINCENDPLTITEPYYPIGLTSPDTIQYITIDLTLNETGYSQYTMNNSTFHANYNHPLLNLTYNGNTSYPDDPQWNVYNFESNETVRIVFENKVPFAHPMHVHGQNMYIVDVGIGQWDGSSAVRPDNPMRRDTQTLPPNGYLVVDLLSDNPGVWPFHCHIAWHVSQGLYINVMQKPHEVNSSTIPEVMAQTCDAWVKFSSDNFVNEIDSGVKFFEE